MAHAALLHQQLSQGGCAVAARRAAGPDLVSASTAASPVCCAGRSEFRCSVVAARRRAFGGSTSSSGSGSSNGSSLRRDVVARALDNPPPPANSISTTSTVTAPAAGVDPFVSASLRLQSLLSSIGDGDDELYNNYLSEEDPAAKMQTVTLVGGVLTVAAVVMASLCGRDPWGGASLSIDSLGAAAVGALLSIPMVYARAWSWSPKSRETAPVFEDMHLAQLEVSRPWLQRLNRAHVVMLMAMEVLPATLLLFPAAQGVLVSSFALYTQLVQDSIAIDASEETVRVWVLLLTAAVASIGRVMELGASPEECEVVQTAVENSDRYYRVVGRDAANSPADAERSAVAFRAVAQAWLETKDEVANVAGVCTFLDVVYLGATWYLTGDLTATACCALLANWVDYYYMHEYVLQKQKKVASHSTHLR